ncbi:MAG: hypothetical protein IJU44_11555 [Kiritimatiellae bacterium]|nr:hypothetical protein [Kiritimatiellia bacterium]
MSRVQLFWVGRCTLLSWTSLLWTDARANEAAGWDEDCLWGGINLKASF